MEVGNLRIAKTKPKKNLLPPFDLWTPIEESEIRDVVKNGYEIGFKTRRTMGLIYLVNNPKEYAGKRLSLSAERLTGEKPLVSIWFNGSHKGSLGKGERLDNILVPTDVYSIRVKIENNHSEDDYVYFKNIQLEEGSVSTGFEEMFEINEGANKIPKKNLLSVPRDIPNQYVVDDLKFEGSFWAYGILSNEWVMKNLKPDTKYSFSGDFTVKSLSSLPLYSSNLGFLLYKGSGYTSYWMGSKPTTSTIIGQTYHIESGFSTPPDLTGYRVLLYSGRYTDGTTVELGKALFSNIQIEEGEIITPFEKYAEKNRDARKNVKEIGTRLETPISPVNHIAKKVLSTELVLKYNKNNSIQALAYSGDNERLDSYISASGQPYLFTDTTTGRTSITSKVSLEHNKVYSIKMVLKSTGREIYVNGQRVASDNSTHSGDVSISKIGQVGGFSLSASTLYYVKVVADGKVTEYGDNPYKNKLSISPKNASRLKFPFIFERNTVEYVNGLRYGLNKPRIVNGGVLIEEGTENLLMSKSGLDGSFESYPVGNTDIFSSQLGGVDRIQITDKMSLNGLKSLMTTGGSRAYKYFGLNAGDYVTFSADVYSTNPNAPFLKFEFQGGSYVWTGVESERHTGSGWEKLSVTFKVDSNTTCYCFIYHNNASNPVYWDNLQVEKKAYQTTFTRVNRPNETLSIPNAIPSEKGIIEFDVDMTIRNPNGSNQPLIYASDASLWVIRTTSGFLRLNKGVSGRFSDSSTLSWEDKLYKFKIVYDNDNVKLFRDGVEVISGTNSALQKDASLNVGCDNLKERHTNLVFRKLVITDVKNGTSKKYI